MKTYGSPQLGARIKRARTKLNFSQDDLAAKLGFNDRQTVSDIETGKRALKTEELLALSETLHEGVQYFLDPFTAAGEAEYCWRAPSSLSEAELDQFEERANGWVGLLRWLRNEHKLSTAPLKLTLPLTASSSFERAELFAEQLVANYDLGPIPADKLVDFVESKLSTPVLFVDTGVTQAPGAISGAACDLGTLGVVLINRSESETRRNFDLAHELFHTLTWSSMKPHRRELNSIADRQGAHRVEQLANSFAAALLMPTSSLEAFIDPDRAEDVNHLVEVAARLRVSTEALSWRLLRAGRIDRSTREALAGVRVSASRGEQPRPFSEDFVVMLHTALSRGWLTARKAAGTMGMTLGELKELFAAHDMQSPFDL